MEGVYLLPSDMNLSIKAGTAENNNEILVSDSGFSLGRSDMVNTSAPENLSYRTPIIPKHAPPMPKAAHTSASEVHEEERVALVLVLTSAFRIWYAFRYERQEMR